MLSLPIVLIGILYAVYKAKEIPESVSGMAYIMPHWAFSVWIALSGILMMPSMMSSLPSRWQWVGFLSILGLLCVASSSYYKTEAKTLHWVGGTICAISALVVVAIVMSWLLLLWIPFFIVLIRWPNDQWLFWIEVMVYVLLLIATI